MLLTPSVQASVLAKADPVNKGPIKPGPFVNATNSISLISQLYLAKSFSSKGIVLSVWSLDANSGTTPPYLLCNLNWELSTCPIIPFSESYRANPVSSHDVSIPSTIIRV